ncbi:receptor-like serine/threonine-protein kinase SD1-8 [Abrus precatorius]|uniref:Receptor-like serine/threonine-protein kinase n=1 Tax=Abrus precatorius TaxID=3816 RepID=A0A8B8LE01_ABRPR|nr:receptor-like serine/threonine-protein kinase SD1-8 [Abrus precatorius]
MGASTNSHIYLTFCFSFFSNIVVSLDTVTVIQSLRINQTLVSPKEVFEFGFFSPSSSIWYLGIWYKDIPDKTVVWVANRDTPLQNSNGTLRIGDKGNLVLLDQTRKSVWSPPNQTTGANSVLQILDSGNLILKETNKNDTTNSLWQSFDHPIDTLLPGMKLGLNLDTGVEHRLTSWKSLADPSSGDFSFRMKHSELQNFSFGTKVKVYRSRTWNGLVFTSLPVLNPKFILQDNMFGDAHKVYYIISNVNQSRHTRVTIIWTGEIQRLVWIESSQSWNKLWYGPKDECDKYPTCGPYSICTSSTFPVCSCIQGFNVRNQEEWNLRTFSSGCVINTALDCGNDKFLHLQHVQPPETTMVFVNRSMTLVECEGMCMKDCSCTTYANVEITNGGTGCVMWTDELLDTRQFSDGGQDLYVRLAASDVEVIDTGSAVSTPKENNTGKVVGIIVAAAIVFLGMIIVFLWKMRKLPSIWKWKWKASEKGALERNQHLRVILSTIRDSSGGRNIDHLRLPLFDFNTITMATNNFSEANKLGQGGFGSVYRGRLVDGQEIAVKRLSKTSGQGNEEFKNEEKSIAKLQHRNLVRLFGCCVEKEEQMLVYEYMENNSLESILFDKDKCSLLDWQMRCDIICKIARGLLYLHHESRLRIIHRDLKASNILLDREMNPKISDFGMARIFGIGQTQANTRRVVRTYGYMSPEYAMDGLFSVKSDVFSFAILVLEIVSGKKNRGFYSKEDINLLGHAWRLWKEGRAVELIDSSFANFHLTSQVLRCIHVGLVCVQN